MIIQLSQFIKPALAATGDIVGNLNLPAGIPGTGASGMAEAGPFISNLIRFIIIVSGLFSLWQFLTGGLGYISSNGDKAKVQEANNKIMMSILGLIIIGASFVITAIIGALVFGDWTFIFNPKIQTL